MAVDLATTEEHECLTLGAPGDFKHAPGTHDIRLKCTDWVTTKELWTRLAGSVNYDVGVVRTFVGVAYVLHNDRQIRSTGQMTEAPHCFFTVSDQGNYMNSCLSGFV